MMLHVFVVRMIQQAYFMSILTIVSPNYSTNLL